MAITSDTQLQEVREIPNKVRDVPDRKIDGRDIQKGTAISTIFVRQQRTYDAIVDASGAGDFNNIEQAVSYVMGLGGGRIFVKSGTYTPSSAISITKPITIEGEGSSLVTVNFNSTASNFAITSTNIYTTGTISSITSGTAVVGSSTVWTSAMAGRYMFLATRWYLIASVTDATHLTLAEAYSDDISLSAYRIATLTVGVNFSGMTIKNSTGAGITATDLREFTTNDVVFLTNNVGVALTNTMLIICDNGGVAGSTSDGVQLTNCGVGGFHSFFSNGNGGNGFTLSTVKTFELDFCEGNSNVEAVKLTSCDLIAIRISARSNSSKGIECVATCNEIQIFESFIKGSTSDGIKLTASSNYCKIIGCHLDTNGGWGVNIATNTSNKNVVMANSFNTNTSGTIQDLGTNDIVLAGSNTA